MTRLARSLAVALAIGLSVAPASVRAQEPAPAEGEGSSEGNPVPGYIATGLLGCAAIFVLCKSARR
jgi:hypothetical protein